MPLFQTPAPMSERLKPRIDCRRNETSPLGKADEVCQVSSSYKQFICGSEAQNRPPIADALTVNRAEGLLDKHLQFS